VNELSHDSKLITFIQRSVTKFHVRVTSFTHYQCFGIGQVMTSETDFADKIMSPPRIRFNLFRSGPIACKNLL